jgi:altered-inheritance-of-mitochondria protein 5
MVVRNRYVETVPLAGQVLEVRESQKLKIIEKLKLERQRVRFEAEIGKTPPLSDDELAEHIQHEA